MNENVNEIAPFTELLKRGMNRANKAWPKLVPVLLLLGAFFIAFVVCLLVLLIFVQGALLRGMPLSVERTLEIIIIVIGLYVLLRFNGAVAYAFAFATTSDFFATPVLQIAKKSWNNGVGFFFNSFGTGMLIIFGQTLAICPCFLMQSNFIFSPYLYVYENLKGFAARKRAREITDGFGWVVLQRSAVFLLIGYIVIALLFISVFAPHPTVFIILALVIALYASSIQSQFLREIYLESKEHRAGSYDKKSKRTWIISALVVVLIAIIVYYAIKFSLHLASLK